MPFVPIRSLSAIGTPSPPVSAPYSTVVRKACSSGSRSEIASACAACSSAADSSRGWSESSACSAVKRSVSITSAPPAPPRGAPEPLPEGYGAETRPWATSLRRNGDFAAVSSNRSPGGDAEEVVLAVRCVRERLVDRERHPRLVLGPDVDHVERVRRRFDAGEIQLRNLTRALAERVERRPQTLELVVRQLEPRQVRHVEHFVAGDRHQPHPPTPASASRTLPGKKSGPLSEAASGFGSERF